jgi:hypothetical protein
MNEISLLGLPMLRDSIPTRWMVAFTIPLGVLLAVIGFIVR